jgi:Ca2+-binding EF-hand superfamily protein
MVTKPKFRVKNLTPADEKKRIALILKLKEAFKKKGITPQAAFTIADKNNDGQVDVKELGNAFENLKLADSLKIRQLCDIDHDGKINQGEFNGIFREVEKDKAESGAFDEEDDAAGDQSAPPK